MQLSYVGCLKPPNGRSADKFLVRVGCLSKRATGGCRLVYSIPPDCRKGGSPHCSTGRFDRTGSEPLVES